MKPDKRIIDMTLSELTEALRSSMGFVDDKDFPNNKRLITLDKFCRETGININNMKKWRYLGKITIKRMGKTLLIDPKKFYEEVELNQLDIK